MSPVTTPHPESLAETPTEPPRSVPSLNELRQMTSQPEHRVVIQGVDWAFYEQLVAATPYRVGIQVDYDGKDVEIMSPSLVHDNDKSLLGRLVEIVAEELEIPLNSAGQTTWKRADVGRGLEADESYFFQREKLDAVAAGKARRSLDIADYPNPDLGIEVDITPPNIDRQGIYAALEVAEIWRLDCQSGQLFIDRLQDNGIYHTVERSGLLPISAAEIHRWVIEEDSRDESAWARRLRAWVRAELAPRAPR
jgi:Uma2 family endonuclease